MAPILSAVSSFRCASVVPRAKRTKIRPMKRLLITITLATALAVAAASLAVQTQQPRFKIVEATIPEMRQAMEQKRLTSRELVTMYLTRIATYEDRLNAVIAIN